MLVSEIKGVPLAGDFLYEICFALWLFMTLVDDDVL